MNLELKTITKAYPGVVANDAVSLSVQRGEIHALLGENGAGKSTLMKILFGLVQPDSGEIFINGKKAKLRSPNDAKALGLGMVQQHFALFEGMNVLENIALGLGGVAANEALRTKTLAVASRYGLSLDPDALVFTLSAGEKQRIEIVRTMLGEPDILILDEPTSVLTPVETEQLFQSIERLSAEGKSVVFITHKLHEVKRICSAATILRRGQVVGTCDPKSVSANEIGTMMLGQELAASSRRKSVISSKQLLVVHRLNTSVEGHRVRVDALEVNAGQIVGIAGVAGNGQEELYKVLSGEHPLTDKQAVVFDRKPIGHKTTNQRRKLGCVFVPEERLGHAAVPHLSLVENALLSNLIDKEHTNNGLINKGAQRRVCEEVTKAFDVRHAGSGKSAKSLSGGNLQKFVVGRELIKKPNLIIINQPTWGVDLGAAKRIRDELATLASKGAAVIVISQDLDELLSLSDHLAVINQGTLSEAKPTKQWGVEALSQAMLGEMTSERPSEEETL